MRTYDPTLSDREQNNVAHRKSHRSPRIGWLRAAVMGTNDVMVSTASLVLGVAAAGAASSAVMAAGAAGLVAGAKSMAAGEYVSVSCQADTEAADLARETRDCRRSGARAGRTGRKLFGASPRARTRTQGRRTASVARLPGGGHACLGAALAVLVGCARALRGGFEAAMAVAFGNHPGRRAGAGNA